MDYTNWVDIVYCYSCYGYRGNNCHTYNENMKFMSKPNVLNHTIMSLVTRIVISIVLRFSGVYIPDISLFWILKNCVAYLSQKQLGQHNTSTFSWSSLILPCFLDILFIIFIETLTYFRIFIKEIFTPYMVCHWGFVHWPLYTSTDLTYKWRR